MVFQILPRKAFTIECELTPGEFHKKLSEAFNPAVTPEAGRSILFDYFSRYKFEQFTSYIYAGDHFEINKFFPGQPGSPGSSVYGIGQIINTGKPLQARIDYFNNNFFAKTATIIIAVLLILFASAYCIDILNKESHSTPPAAPLLLMGFLLAVILLIRFFMSFQLTLLHRQVVLALSG